MTVRDAAVADIVPKMTELEGYGNSSNPRLIYNLGHAVFEFIEAKFGKEGIRQFLFSLRKSVIGGGEDAYEEALQMKKDEFDQAFERYLKDRFKPFRDKERPADYGRDLVAEPGEDALTPRRSSIAPSPSGDLIAVVTVNRKDRELDIVLRLGEGRLDRPQPDAAASTRTSASTTSCSSASDWTTMPWMSWSPKGDRLAYFVRTEKERTLIIQNVLTRKIEERIPMKTVDEPESPDFSPDGRRSRSRRCAAHRRHLHASISRPRQVTNLTNDDFADYGADLLARRQVHRLHRARQRQREAVPPRSRHQEEDAAHLRHARRDRRRSSSTTTRIVFSSTATDPAVPLEPEVAKNGNIYNIWTLDLKTGELRQYTDALGGNWSPVVLNDGHDEPHRVRQLLQGRVQHPHARAEGAAAHRRHRPTSARPGRSSTSRRRCSTRWSRRTSARRARSRRCSSRAGRR